MRVIINGMNETTDNSLVEVCLDECKESDEVYITLKEGTKDLTARVSGEDFRRAAKAFLVL